LAANLVEVRHRLHRRSSSPSHAPNLPDGTRPRAPGWIETLVRGES
jgi:hypothetical protein